MLTVKFGRFPKLDVKADKEHAEQWLHQLCNSNNKGSALQAIVKVLQLQSFRCTVCQFPTQACDSKKESRWLSNGKFTYTGNPDNSSRREFVWSDIWG